LKIFIFNLLPLESEKIDYLKSIIENKETEYKKKLQKDIKKLFIFLIHVERINKKDLESQYKEHMDLIRKKMLTHTLSNLAGYYQYLSMISMDKIIMMPKIKLFH